MTVNDKDVDEIYDAMNKTKVIKTKEKKTAEKTPSKNLSDDDKKGLYSHITELKIQLFLIESAIDPLCEYCEAWKANEMERNQFKRIDKLLKLDDTIVHVEEVMCDWNCLFADKYYDKLNHKAMQYDLEIAENGTNWLEMYGMDIEYCPAIFIKLKSSKYEKGKKYFKAIFQGIGEKKIKEFSYSFNGKIYKRKKKIIEVHILKPLMNFLKALTFDNVDSKLEIHEKFSLSLGQTHRQVDV